MAKITIEYESLYDKGDVVLFHNNRDKDSIFVGIVRRFYIDDGTIWYDIQYTKDKVYDYNHFGDIGEYDIVGKIECEEDARKIRAAILNLKDDEVVKAVPDN